jgi:membrane-bound metal-dependent hydrolase YbcI (DUF457 family)
MVAYPHIPIKNKTMNIITHSIIGWVAGQRFAQAKSDVALVTIASVIPDLDAVGVIYDLFSGGETELFSKYHHVWGHNIFFCLIVALLAYKFSQNKLRTSILCFILFHLHLVCDVIGARGPDGFQWPVQYFFPISDFGIIWSGQWEINAWPNFVITLIGLIILFWQIARFGYSPLFFVSREADNVLVSTVKTRLKQNLNDNQNEK